MNSYYSREKILESLGKLNKVDGFNKEMLRLLEAGKGKKSTGRAVDREKGEKNGRTAFYNCNNEAQECSEYFPQNYLFTYKKEGINFIPYVSVLSAIYLHHGKSRAERYAMMKEEYLDPITSYIILDEPSCGVLFCNWQVNPFDKKRDFLDLSILTDTVSTISHSPVLVLAIRSYCYYAISLLKAMFDSADLDYKHISFP